jgi:hypothetical protein
VEEGALGYARGDDTGKWHMTTRWITFGLVLALGSGASALAAADKELPASLDDLFALDDADAKPGAPASSRDALFELAPTPNAGVDAVTPPTRRDDLFALPPAERGPAREQALPASRDALFGDTPAAAPAIAARTPPETPASRWRGFLQGELAYLPDSPAHWSKAMGRLELGTQGRLAQGGKWKLSGRVDYNGIFDLDDHYARAVRKDQRAEFHVRESYVDFAAADMEWRIGRQHIVWGEMVGLFFADVVSAKDLREFVLPDFQILRIPQWAARAERFGEDFHLEAIWIPFPSYDKVGRPGDGIKAGADYFAYPPVPALDGGSLVLPNVVQWTKPSNQPSHTNFGVRLSTLTQGWDIGGFLYSSMDSAPTYRLVGKTPLGPGMLAYNYRAEHRRIHQAGATFAKDFQDFVLKGEAIYTHGRSYNVRDPADGDGLARQHTLDWVLGFDFQPGADTRINAQLFQRVFVDHDERIVPDQVESGATLLLNHKFARDWEVDVLAIHSLNRSDWLLRPKLIWNFQQNWRMTFGADIFGGPADGLFGQFDKADRIYGEVRYDF